MRTLKIFPRRTNATPACGYMAFPGVHRAGNLPDRILCAVCAVEKVSINDILGASRIQKTVTARHLFCWAALKKGYRHEEIGKMINKHRTTVIYSEKTVNNLIATDPRTRQAAEEIQKQLGG